MPTRFIRAILFDLGNTLLYNPHPWAPILTRAERALAESLCRSGLDLDCENFHLDFKKGLKDYYARRDEDLFESTTESMLRRLLAEKGFSDTPAAIIRDALDAFYAVTQENWVVEDDTLSTLSQLQDRGYRMGIVSNAADHKDVQELVEKACIEPFLDFVVTSASCSYRKPHARIFEISLAHWGLQPYEAAMVGDTLDADVLGANEIGIYSIWITRRANTNPKTSIIPQTTVQTLAEIPETISPTLK